MTTNEAIEVWKELRKNYDLNKDESELYNLLTIRLKNEALQVVKTPEHDLKGLLRQPLQTVPE